MPTTKEKIEKNLLLDDNEMKTIGEALYSDKNRNCEELRKGNVMYWGVAPSKYQAFYSQRLFNENNKFNKEFFAGFNDGTYEKDMEKLDEVCVNAPFRWGLSAHLNDKNAEMYPTYKKCEDLLNRRMLERTLEPVDQSKIEEYRGNLHGGEDYSKYLSQKQEVIAKLLFIQQLAGVKIYKDNDSPAEFMTGENLVLDTLVHGGRTCMIMPKSSDTNKMFDPVVGANKGQEAGIYERSAATHSVNGKSFDGTESLEETNHTLAIGNLKNQYGMDLAVGGFGQKGLHGRTITADGTFGHMYMRLDPGDTDHYGTFMFGCEGSAAGKKNQTGQTHTITATKNKQSAFLCDKNGVGKTIGGRVIDLSNVDENVFSNIMKAFHESYSALQNLASEGNSQARDKINKIHTTLMGKPLSKDEMVKLATGMGIDEKKIKETYIKSRVPNEMVMNGRRIKKPGFFTRLKAFFRIGSARRKVEAYEKAKEQLQNIPAQLQQAVESDQRNEEARNNVYENRLQSSLDLFEMTDEKIPNRDEENKADLFSVIKDFKNNGSNIKEFLKHYYTGKCPVKFEYTDLETAVRNQDKDNKDVQELMDNMTNALVSLHKNMCTSGSDGTNAAKDLTSMVICGKMIGKLLGMAEKYPVLIDKDKMGNLSKKELEDCVKVADRLEDSMKCEGSIMLRENTDGQTVGMEDAKKLFIGKSLETLIQQEHGFNSIIKNYDAFAERMEQIAADSNNVVVQELSNTSRDAYKNERESFWDKNKENLDAVLNPKAAKQKEMQAEAKEKETTSVKQAEKHEEKKAEKASGKIL